MGWRQRVYAFLLRRVLSPYLTSSSKEKLHESIEVSLREGKFVLKDVELNSDYLTSLLNVNFELNFDLKIQQFKARKLSISLSLKDNNTAKSHGDEDSTDGTSGVVRKIYNFGGKSSNCEGSRVALVAHVEIEGLEIEVCPRSAADATVTHDFTVSGQNEATSDAEEKSEKSLNTGMLSSYVEAALNSLSLSLAISDISLTAFGHNFSSTEDTARSLAWIQISLGTVSYHDLTGNDIRSRSNVTSFYAGELTAASPSQVVLYKEIEFSELAIEVGGNHLVNNHKVDVRTAVKVDNYKARDGKVNTNKKLGGFKGPGRVRLRVTSVASARPTAIGLVAPRLHRDLEISLCQRFWFSCNVTALDIILTVVTGMSSEKHDIAMNANLMQDEATRSASIASPHNVESFGFNEDFGSSNNEDESEVDVLAEIIRQQMDAQHMARTGGIRGGELVPYIEYSCSGIAGNNVVFDTFFDANSQSFSHFKSMLDSSTLDSTEKSGGFAHTTISFYLLELDFKVAIRQSSASDCFRDGCGSFTAEEVEECVLFTLANFDIVATLSESVTDVTVSLSSFEVEVFDTVREIIRGDVNGLLCFVEVADDSEAISDSHVVTSAQCFAMHLAQNRLRKNIDVCNQVSVDIALQPLELMYHKADIAKISNMIEVYFSSEVRSLMGGTKLKSDAGSAENFSFELTAFCPSITFLLPFDQLRFSSSGDNRDASHFLSLFQRSGYIVPHRVSVLSPTIGCTLDDLHLVVCTSPAGSLIGQSRHNSNADDCETHASITCQSSIIFVCGPVNTSNLVRDNSFTTSSFMNRFDFVSLSGETLIDPRAAIKVDAFVSLSTQKKYAQSKRSNFPLVTPLSSVKASQQYESNDVDEMYTTPLTTATDSSPRSKKRYVRGSDPQRDMYSAACETQGSIDIHIPCMLVDSTPHELNILVDALSELFSNNEGDVSTLLRQNENDCNYNEEFDDKCEDDELSVEAKKNEPVFGVSIRLDQMSVGLHSNVDDSRSKIDWEDGECARFHYLLVFDGIRSHFLFGAHDLKQIRVLAQDATFYEVKNVIADEQVHCKPFLSKLTSMAHRRKLISLRLKRRSSSITTAILFRSKLSPPLSPETPAALLDILVCQDSDGDTTEKAVHLTIYDMTYRYELDSCWVQRLSYILQSIKQPNANNGQGKGAQSCATEPNQSTVTNLFVTVSDSCFDYTSPHYFERPSRTIVRVSEVRISSNLIIPSGAVQVYKVSVADVAVYLSNQRVSHVVENSRLSCAKLVFGSADMVFHDENASSHSAEIQSLEKSLAQMSFINVATLDCLDTALSVANPTGGCPEKIFDYRQPQHPSLTVTLSIGRTWLYTCRDSFACLTDTFGEWMLKLLTPSNFDIPATNNGQTVVNASEVFYAQSSPSNVLGEVNYALNTESSDTCLKEGSGGKTIEEKKDSACLSMTVADLIDRDVFLPIFSASSSLRHDVPQVVVEKKSTSHVSPMFANILGCNLATFESQAMNDLNNLHESTDNALSSSLNKNYSAAAADTVRNDLLHHSEPRNEFRSANSTCSLSGQGWTTVDYGWSRDHSVAPYDDQSARWYHKPEGSCLTSRDVCVGWNDKKVSERPVASSPQIFPQHISVNPVSDPLSGGDMNAAKFAGTKQPPAVKIRVIIKEMSLSCRFFDGYDWMLQDKKNSRADGYQVPCYTRDNDGSRRLEKTSNLRTKDILIRELIDEGFTSETSLTDRIFGPALIPQHGVTTQAVVCRKSRQTNQFFQFSFTGLKFRLDSFVEVPHHRLASCIDLALSDLFLSETVSCGKPVKILGEWLNDKQHPRDSNDGMLMMKMVSMRPVNKLSSDGKFMSEESRVTLELLPLRFFVYQTAGQFIREFFSGDGVTLSPQKESVVSNGPAETFFQNFKIKPCKLKVDYRPSGIDRAALRDGSYVELINLLPLEDMVLTLAPVEMRNLSGWGSIISELLCRWVENICQTQMHKFITQSTPFQPFANLGGSLSDLIMIPLEGLKKDRNMMKAIKTGAGSFGGTVAYEAINTTAKLTKFAADKLSRKSQAHRLVALPARPDISPRTVSDAACHALESVARGLKEANTKIIIIPYREYYRSGPARAVKSVVYGIPVAVCAPLSGASEAVSYALLGVRNQLRPELRREEEESRRGLGNS